MTTKKFITTPGPTGGISEKEWDAYWKGLTEAERQSLRDKAQWEHMSLIAVAREWGAVAQSNG